MAGSENVRFSIEKLNGENYQLWQHKIKIMLMKDNAWSVIDQEILKPEDENYEDWKRKNDHAYTVINMLVEDNQLIHILDATTAKEAWNILKDYNLKSSLSSKIYLRKRLFRMRLEEGGDMEAHIVEFLKTVSQLAAVGKKFDDEDLAAMLLCSLPGSYDTLVTALESRPEKEITLNFVKGKLMDEFNKRKDKVQIQCEEEIETAMKVSESRIFREKECFWCKSKGHFKRECKDYINWKAQQDRLQDGQSIKEQTACAIYNDDMCFYSASQEQAVNKSAWVIDSAASCHMTNSGDNFELFSKNVSQVFFGNGGKEVSTGKGTKSVDLIVAGKIQKMKVTDILLVPKLECNILSVKALTKKGFTVIFEKETCKVMRQNLIVAVAVENNGFYKLICKESQTGQQYRKINLVNQSQKPEVSSEVEIEFRHFSIDSGEEKFIDEVVKEQESNKSIAVAYVQEEEEAEEEEEETEERQGENEETGEENIPEVICREDVVDQPAVIEVDAQDKDAKEGKKKSNQSTTEELPARTRQCKRF